MTTTFRDRDHHQRQRIVLAALLLFGAFCWMSLGLDYFKGALRSSRDSVRVRSSCDPSHTTTTMQQVNNALNINSTVKLDAAKDSSNPLPSEEEEEESPSSSSSPPLLLNNGDSQHHQDDTDNKKNRLSPSAPAIINTTLPFVPTRTMYSVTRTDRSGAAITDMLLAHAMAYANGWQYGGACGEAKPERIQQVQSLLDDTGLAQILQFACPRTTTARNYMNSKEYLYHEKEYLTPAWLDYMSRAVPLYRNDDGHENKNDDNDNDDTYKIAVHIRRGDVSACSSSAWQRYLPNSHYLRILDQIMANLTTTSKTDNVQVTIYSESPDGHHAQYEGFEEFEQRGYRLHLDGDLRDVWKAFITADALVMGQSTFSMVPGILRVNRPGTYFCPYKHAYALDHWHVVSDHDMRLTDQEMDALQKERCPEQGRETDREKYFANRDHFLGYDD